MSDCILSKSSGGAASDECTAVLADVLEGMTAVTRDSGDEPARGTMVNKAGTSQETVASVNSADSRVEMTIPAAGKYTESSKLYTAFAGIASLIGLTADKLWPGNTILGIKSSRQTMAGGTVTPNTSAVKVACKDKAMTSDITIPAFALPPANKLMKGYKYTLYGKTVNGTAVYAGDTPGYFLEPPKEYEELTGGWGDYCPAGTALTKGTSSYDMKVNALSSTISDGYFIVGMDTDNTIDYSLYRYIYVDYEITPKFRRANQVINVMCATTVVTGPYTSARVYVSKSFSKNGSSEELGTLTGTLKLDVSSYTKKAYLGIGICSNDSVSKEEHINGTVLKIKAVRYDKIQEG